MIKFSAAKRVVLTIMALFMLLAAPVSGNAATQRIVAKRDGAPSLEEMYQYGASYSGDYQELGDLEVRPKDEIRIPITADMFEWSGKNPVPHEATRLSQLRGKVSVKANIQTGHEVLDYIQFDWDTFGTKSNPPFFAPGTTIKAQKTAYISIMFAEKIKSTKDIPFRIEVGVSVNGKTHEDFKITLRGKMLVDVIEADKGTDYIDISDGTVVKASEYVRRTKLDLGNGVVVHKNLHQNNKYYGISGIKDSGYLIKEEFPDIYDVVAGVYKLETINLRWGLSEVEITPQNLELEKDEYFVYSENMQYLGKTTELLPYSDVYILTVEKLDTFQLGSYEDDLLLVPTDERPAELVESNV